MWKQINKILTLPVLIFIALTIILMWSTTIKSAINTKTSKENQEFPIESEVIKDLPFKTTKQEWITLQENLIEIQESLTVSRFLKELDRYNKKMKCLETWERTKDYENYRVATSTDFKFPSWVSKQPTILF